MALSQRQASGSGAKIKPIRIYIKCRRKINLGVNNKGEMTSTDVLNPILKPAQIFFD
jgi:hypothetical protein